MRFSEEQIKEWQDIFEKDYGKKFSRQETFEAANNLVAFFDLLLKIDRRVNPQRYKLKRKKIY